MYSLLRNVDDCYELVEFICNELDSYPYEGIFFRGDFFAVSESTVEKEISAIIKDNTLIVTYPPSNGYFLLTALKSPIDLKQNLFPCITIPCYLREELFNVLLEE